MKNTKREKKMTTSRFEVDDEVVTDDEEELISFTKEEINSLLDECMYSYISYMNPVARSVIRKMMDFVGVVEVFSK